MMVTWLWNLIQGDFAQNPTAWMDLAITVLGIVLSPVAWFTSKCLEGKAAKREAKDAQEKFDAQLEVLKGQLKAANDSVDALRAARNTSWGTYPRDRPSGSCSWRRRLCARTGMPTSESPGPFRVNPGSVIR